MWYTVDRSVVTGNDSLLFAGLTASCLKELHTLRLLYTVGYNCLRSVDGELEIVRG